MSKGILGVGCSYTWGEGLYFYSELDNLPFSEEHYFDYDNMTPSMLLYKDRFKYTQLVADYLNTWCWTNCRNGGSILGTINDFACKEFINNDKFKYSDFKLLIYQFTEHYRDSHNGMSESELIEFQINSVDDLCSDFEKAGIKVITLSWFDTIPQHPTYLSKFKNRHLDIEFDNIVKSGFDFILRNDEYNMTIQSDFYKKGFQKNDLHFNKKGHRLIADLIIDKLKEDNFKL